MSQLFASGGQSTAASTSASVLPMNIQGWFLLGWTDVISLQSKGLSRVLQHHSLKASILSCSAFLMAQLSHHSLQAMGWSLNEEAGGSGMLWDFTALWDWVSSGQRVAGQEQGDSALCCCLLRMPEAWRHAWTNLHVTFAPLCRFVFLRSTVLVFTLVASWQGHGRQVSPVSIDRERWMLCVSPSRYNPGFLLMSWTWKWQNETRKKVTASDPEEIVVCLRT